MKKSVKSKKIACGPHQARHFSFDVTVSPIELVAFVLPANYFHPVCFVLSYLILWRTDEGRAARTHFSMPLHRSSAARQREREEREQRL